MLWMNSSNGHLYCTNREAHPRQASLLQCSTNLSLNALSNHDATIASLMLVKYEIITGPCDVCLISLNRVMTVN